MCGIAGIWRHRAPFDDAALLAVVGRMTASVAHRGPDGGGIWHDVDAGLALGQRRLAVVDLSPTGTQPMTSRSGRWTVTYNGELYGVGAVRATLLAQGTRFRGTSDTEVLVEALDRWGLDATLAAVDGMFAFAAWDADRRRLHLVRDRFGEKPLCYGQLDGAIVFASETRAIRAGFRRQLGIDRRAVAALLELRCIPAPLTIHPELRKVLPGGGVTVAPDGSVTPWRYWDADAPLEDPPLDAHDALELLDAELRRSVADRLAADVPVGIFLSGGLDSALVTALAQEQVSEPVRTFTLGFAEAAYDESAAAAAIAAHLGTRHHELRLTAAEALAIVPELPTIADEPLADSSLLPTFAVSRLAREQVTVALSGDGADELFGGYNRHRWLPLLWKRAGRVPLPVRRRVAAGVRAIPAAWVEHTAALTPARYRVRQPGLKQQKLALVLDAPDLEQMALVLARDWPLAPLVDGPAFPYDPFPAAQGRQSATRRAMAVDVAHFLPNDVLAKVDRAAMAVSLEVRAPYLGRAVFDVARRLPDELLPPGAPTKAALRALLEPRVPAALWDRPKSGFGIPLGAWLRGPLRPWVEELLASPELQEQGIDRAAVDRIWAASRREPTGTAPYLVWNVLTLAAWLRRPSDLVAPPSAPLRVRSGPSTGGSAPRDGGEQAAPLLEGVLE